MKKNKIFKRRQRKFVSIQTKFIVLLVCTGVFITIVNSSILNHKLREQYVELYGEVIQNKMDVMDERISELTSFAERTADVLISQQILREDTTSKQNNNILKAFQAQKENCPEIINIIFSRKKDILIYPKNDLVANQVPENADWFIERRDGASDSAWTEPYTDAASGEWIMTYYKKVFQGDEFIGFIELDISMEHIVDMVSSITLGENGKLYVTTNGQVLFSPFDLLSGKDIPDEELYNAVMNSDSGLFEYQSANEKKLAAFRIVESYPEWKLVGLLPDCEIEAKKNEILFGQVICIFILFTLSIIFAILITRRISKNLGKLNHSLSLFGEGDLTTDFSINSNDEIANMGEELNNTAGGIKDLIGTTKETSNTLFTEVSQISALAVQTTEGTNQIANYIEDIAVSSIEQADETKKIVNHFEELNDAMKSINDSIADVDSMVEETQNMNKQGVDTVQKLLEATQITNNATDTVRTAIEAIQKTSCEIDSIIQTINDISSQTNLLALNASIEAARAGESGKGFAVVADEVKQLSESTAASANDIMHLIERVKEQTNEAVKDIVVVTNCTKQQTVEVENTKTAFASMSDSVVTLNESVNKIGELNKNMFEMKDNMMKIIHVFSDKVDENSQVTQEITGMIQEQNATMTSLQTDINVLADCAKQLQNEIDRFKIEEDK